MTLLTSVFSQWDHLLGVGELLPQRQDLLVPILDFLVIVSKDW